MVEATLICLSGAEFQIPAAIGCGEQIFDRVIKAHRIEIDCLSGVVQPLV